MTYPDSSDIHFLSNMIADEDIKPGQIRRLSVDNPLVVPAGKTIRVLTTGADVIHSFFIPSLGVQRYAIPGRTIETWMKIDQPGDYYGRVQPDLRHQSQRHADPRPCGDGRRVSRPGSSRRRRSYASDAGPGRQHFAAVAARLTRA